MDRVVKASADVADSEVWKGTSREHGPWRHPLYRDGFYRLATDGTVVTHEVRIREQQGKAESSEVEEEERDELEDDASAVGGLLDTRYVQKVPTPSSAGRATRSQNKGKGKESVSQASRASAKHDRSSSAEVEEVEEAPKAKTSSRAPKKARREPPVQLPVAFAPGAKRASRGVSLRRPVAPAKSLTVLASASAARTGSASCTRTSRSATTASSTAVAAILRGTGCTRSGMTARGMTAVSGLGVNSRT